MKKKLATYKEVYKRAGWKGLVRELGPKAAIALFAFFFIKGLVWLAVFYGAWEMAS